jgi:hypothetical protein
MGSLSGTLIQGAKIETTQTDVLALQRAQAEQITLQAKRQQERLEAQMASNPMMQARMNSTFANAISDAGMFRQFGMSGNDIKVGLGGSINAANLMRARAYDQARDVGELAAAAQEMGGTAGRGFLGKYGASLDAKTGGLHNAAQILGVGAQFGGGGYGGGKSFLGGIQGMIGRGGVDVTAGAQVSGLGMGAMTAANFLGTTGSGLMSTLLQAGATGSTGGDMRAAREMGWGMQSRETQAGGGIDALNKAMNLSAAMKASPDAPWTVRNTLSSMSDASIIDILKTGQVPDILANNGVTLDMVQKYHAATNVTKFARFASSDEYGTEAQRGAVGRFREAGGIGYLKGMSSKQRSAELDTLAGALATGTGVSMATARADLGIEAAIAGVGPMVKGRGAHDSFDRKSIAGKAAEAKAILEAAEGEKISVESEQYRKVFGNMPLAVAHNEVARLQGQAGTKDGDVGTAIQSITEALNHFVDAMKTEFSGGGKTGGHGAPKVQ